MTKYIILISVCLMFTSCVNNGKIKEDRPFKEYNKKGERLWQMKLPEYSLKEAIELKDDIKFDVGTLLFVFWNDFYVPDHRKEELKEAKRYERDNDRIVMCIIGKQWVCIPVSKIRTRTFWSRRI